MKTLLWNHLLWWLETLFSKHSFATLCNTSRRQNCERASGTLWILHRTASKGRAGASSIWQSLYKSIKSGKVPALSKPKISRYAKAWRTCIADATFVTLNNDSYLFSAFSCRKSQGLSHCKPQTRHLNWKERQARGGIGYVELLHFNFTTIHSRLDLAHGATEVLFWELWVGSAYNTVIKTLSGLKLR